MDLGFRTLRVFFFLVFFCFVFLLWASFNSELATSRVPTRFLRALLTLPHTLISLCHLPESHKDISACPIPDLFIVPSASFFFFASSDLLPANFVFVQDCWSPDSDVGLSGNMEQLHKVYDPAEAYRAGQCLINSTLGAQLVLAACQRCVGSAIAQLW